MELVLGSAVSMPSLRRRIMSAWAAGVLKKPELEGSQKRDVCVSEGERGWLVSDAGSRRV